MSGLDTSQPITDEQATQEGHLKGKDGHHDPKADEIAETAKAHSAEALQAQQPEE